MNRITEIHKGQTFCEGTLYNEHFSVFLEDADKMLAKILNALKHSAIAIIPKQLIDRIVYSSIDFADVRIFSWRFGSEAWVNETLVPNYYVVENRQVYKN